MTLVGTLVGGLALSLAVCNDCPWYAGVELANPLWGRSCFGGVPVLARADYWVWWGSSHFRAGDAGPD